VGRLEEAVAADRAALKEWTRDRVPLDWAMAQNNLGSALLTVGEREPGTSRLAEATTAFLAVLDVFEEAAATHYMEGTRRNLAREEALIKERRR
jgi:hypothetical protein